MSSILKALKKLESEKAQRDELSTAVASDILRSSRRRSRHPVTIAAVIVVGLVLVGGAGYLLAVSQQEAETAPAAASRPVEKPVAAPETERVTPVVTQAVQPVDLPQLSGIAWQENPADRLAIINDLPVMEGTSVEDYVVRRIRPDRVVLVKGGDEYTLRLIEE